MCPEYFVAYVPGSSQHSRNSEGPDTQTRAEARVFERNVLKEIAGQEPPNALLQKLLHQDLRISIQGCCKLAGAAACVAR